jgi:NitT/TauT family transport system substrate-binding protein
MQRGTIALALSLGLWAASAAAEPIKVGLVGVNAFAAAYLAEERGYFAAEGVPAELVYFDAAAPVAVATVSGAVDFGFGAVTAALYNLGGAGELKIIAGAAHETPGFRIQTFLASRRAFDAGLTSLKALAGHSFGVTTRGAPPVYVVGGILAPKYGFDFASITVLSLQSIPNIMTALAGGRCDFTAVSPTPGTAKLIDRGEIKQLAWVGDVAPWQFAVVLTSTKTANERSDTVKRFLHAIREGAKAYHDAVTAPDGKPKAGPAADEMVRILAKYTKQSEEDVRLGLPYLDPENRLDVADILRQIAFYKAQGLVKPEIDGAQLIDRRYVVPLAK